MSNSTPNHEGLAIVDDNTWIWQFCKTALVGTPSGFLKVPSNLSFRENWSRFHRAPFIIVHWENTNRPSGALIEEVLEIDTVEDPTNRIIIITTDPLHEDVIYFSELGISRIVRLRHRDDDLRKASTELKAHLETITRHFQDADASWRQLRQSIDRLQTPAEDENIRSIQAKLTQIGSHPTTLTARRLEAEAALALKTNNPKQSVELALKALDLNPNFFKAWNTLVAAKASLGKHEDAYAILQKLQLRNRNSVRRLSDMGHQLIALRDLEKAEQFFRSALDRDKSYPGALNGLAEINFLRDDFDTAKILLAKSDRSRDFAVKLNAKGIELVRAKNYEDALKHYTHAQYVLPEASIGHQLFYNIALAYIKWGKAEVAEKFLTLSLVKHPEYVRAKKLLMRIKSRSSLEDLDL